MVGVVIVNLYGTEIRLPGKMVVETVLLALEGRTNEQIAEVRGVSRWTVQAQMRQFWEFVKELLGEDQLPKEPSEKRDRLPEIWTRINERVPLVDIESARSAELRRV